MRDHHGLGPGAAFRIAGRIGRLDAIIQEYLLVQQKCRPPYLAGCAKELYLNVDYLRNAKFNIKSRKETKIYPIPNLSVNLIELYIPFSEK